MQIERCDRTEYGAGRSMPPRVFVSLTAAEIEHAIRAYAEDQGEPIPPGQVYLATRDGHRLAGISVAVEYIGPLDAIAHLPRVYKKPPM